MKLRGMHYRWIGLMSLSFLIMAGVVFRSVMADPAAATTRSQHEIIPETRPGRSRDTQPAAQP